MTVTPPADDFLYWGLTIANPWMESYDYRYTTTSLNNRRASAVRRRLVASGHLAVAIPVSATGSTPVAAGRATCSSVGCSPTRPPHPACEIVPIDQVRGFGRLCELRRECSHLRRPATSRETDAWAAVSGTRSETRRMRTAAQTSTRRRTAPGRPDERAMRGQIEPRVLEAVVVARPGRRGGPRRSRPDRCPELSDIGSSQRLVERVDAPDRVGDEVGVEQRRRSGPRASAPESRCAVTLSICSSRPMQRNSTSVAWSTWSECIQCRVAIMSASEPTTRSGSRWVITTRASG